MTNRYTVVDVWLESSDGVRTLDHSFVWDEEEGVKLTRTGDVWQHNTVHQSVRILRMTQAGLLTVQPLGGSVPFDITVRELVRRFHR